MSADDQPRTDPPGRTPAKWNSLLAKPHWQGIGALLTAVGLIVTILTMAAKESTAVQNCVVEGSGNTVTTMNCPDGDMPVPLPAVSDDPGKTTAPASAPPATVSRGDVTSADFPIYVEIPPRGDVQQPDGNGSADFQVEATTFAPLHGAKAGAAGDGHSCESVPLTPHGVGFAKGQRAFICLLSRNDVPLLVEVIPSLDADSRPLPYTIKVRSR